MTKNFKHDASSILKKNAHKVRPHRDRQVSRTKTERAYERLKRAILRGELTEGTFLEQGDMLRRYAIGRTPFREACNRLDHEQLLEVVPRRGYKVSEISFRTVREIFETRLMLEGWVAEWACLRATPEQLAELETIERSLPETHSIEVMDDFEQWVKVNTQFHLCLAKMTHNRALVRMVSGILDQAERFSYLQLYQGHSQHRAIQSLHRGIVDAIRKRDPKAARQAVAADIRQGEADLFGPVEGAELPKIWQRL